MNVSKETLRRSIRFYQDLINYNRRQIKILISEGHTEESLDLYIGNQSIEFYQKKIRECKIELEVLFSKAYF